MPYKKYGETFRRIREQKRLALSSFVSIGISKGTLSKFERGESMMSFDKVVFALQYMGITLEEFEHFLNGYSLSESAQLLEELKRATITQDKEMLFELSEAAEREGFHFIALSAKCSYTSLSPNEIDDITDYLYEVTVWSYKALCIFYYTMHALATRDILHILDFFLAKAHELFNSEKHRNYLVQVCCRAICILSCRKQKESAEYILQRLDTYKLVNSMFLRNLHSITEGFWIYCFEDKLKGDTQMLKALDVFYAVSTPEIAKYYQCQYDYYVKDVPHQPLHCW